MRKEGRIRRLLVRPFQSVDIGFNMPGVISGHNTDIARLGVRVKATFTLPALYASMRQEFELDGGGQPQDLSFNSSKISSTFEMADPASNSGDPELLFALRNEALKENLDQAFLRRKNEFLEKYQHRDDIVSKFQAIYGDSDWDVDPDAATATNPSSRVGRLRTLQKAMRRRYDELKTAYSANQHDGVQTETVTETRPTGLVLSETRITAGLGMSSEVHRTKVKNKEEDEFKDSQWLIHNLDDESDEQNPAGARSNPTIWSGSDWNPLQPVEGDSETYKLTREVKTKSRALVGGEYVDPTGKQSTKKLVTKNRTFIAPKRVNDIRLQRNQVNLQDELLSEEIATLGMADLATLMNNELRIIDAQVHKLQLNLVHTYLTPPISGVVTAVYKDVGESVTAGEPVIRIENDKSVLLVGRVKLRANVRLGANATIVTDDLYESGQLLRLEAKVVSVRGHDADNDEWDLVLECDNPLVDPTDDADFPARGRRLPINYHFDQENTSIEFDA